MESVLMNNDSPDSVKDVLRRGDLVRISPVGLHSSKRFKDREGQIGRIAHWHQDEVENVVLYDVEWVLGGRSVGIRREELEYTTAEQEGMTGDRHRQKRKPSHFMEEVVKQDAAKKKARAERKAAKTVIKKVAVKPKLGTKTPKVKSSAPSTSKTASKPAKIKKGASKTKEPKTAKVKKPTEKPKQSDKRKQSDVIPVRGKKRKLGEKPAPEPPVYTPLDLFEKQRREFERIVTRLQKVDGFGHFWDDVPPEYDECYTTAETGVHEPATVIPTPMESPAQVTVDEANDVAQPSQQDCSTPSLASSHLNRDEPIRQLPSVKKLSPKKMQASMPIFPDHPPYNWVIVQRRMENGRYLTNREAKEQEERLKVLGPYYKLIGKRPKKVNFKKVAKKLHQNPRVLYPKGIDWETFKDDVLRMCDARLSKFGKEDASARSSISAAAKKIKEATVQAYERTGLRQVAELAAADDAHKFAKAIEKSKNTEAAMQSWRKLPFPERRYERLSTDVVSAGLSSLDERIASYELKTSLPDSFIGLSYRYDDTGQSEAWMKSVVDETGAAKISTSDSTAREAAMALEADIGVIRAQVANTMNTLLIAVQDRVLTDQSVLRQPELRSSNWMAANEQDTSNDKDIQLCPEVTEQPVWGIDCYTRRNILACLETEFDPVTALEFVEKWLLPAINACPEEIAHEIANAARILEGLPLEVTAEEGCLNLDSSVLHKSWSHSLVGQALREKIKRSAPCWLKAAANQLRRARVSLGPDFFRIHPKGHGSILLCPKIEANRLVTFYRGEVYPSWRWGEKMDAIEITQQRKGLKPALPDFYNMALERPQTDPRGYGLLFVDASRKAGHGSSLSHSCAPTCEVRVAALNGELCLAMTTLRELEMGEELTFDYNAVTESLNEYRSAVCLCGYGKCRGSFLHFATADCYQRVLNRNAPVATRFASLVKGCMKQVMSDDDDRILRNHGFVTAAFGAISVNRRFAESHNDEDSCLDSIEMVPIWLRTFVADTLRYIEYERRALPIALICDHISKKRKPHGDPASSAFAKEPKREPPFFYYSRSQMEYFKELLKKQGFPIQSASGVEARQAVLRIASSCWQSLDDGKKEFWKQQTEDDYQSKMKAWRNQNSDSKKNGPRKSGQDKPNKQRTPQADDLLNACDISFEDADAEGVSAMEQRIQQLTQTLSRVGRVLDRHREAVLIENEFASNELAFSPENLRKLVNAPISMVRDDEVIGWMWSSPHGVVSQLIDWVRESPFFRSCLVDSLLAIKSKFKELDSFPIPTWPETIDQDVSTSSNALQGRGRLQSALMEMRRLLQKEFRMMGKVYRKWKVKSKQQTYPELTSQQPLNEPHEHENFNGAIPDDALEYEPDTGIPNDVDTFQAIVEQCPDIVHSCADSSVLVVPTELPAGEVSVQGKDALNSESMCHNLVCDAGKQDSVIHQDVTMKHDGEEIAPLITNSSESAGQRQEHVDGFESRVDEENPWIAHYGYRFVLLLAADVLLFYARTSTFFVIKPYQDLHSTPIEVYARELGNSVPKSVIDNDIAVPSKSGGTNPNKSPANKYEQVAKSANKGELCQPDDIVAKVTVSYEGDFILSQLLQWYNGGIGQKKGLPDLLGCVYLPSLSDCLQSDLINKTKSSNERRTFYESKVRPKLVEWFQDPFQRGSPWPEEVASAFRPKSPSEKGKSCFQPFGSPVLDFLVTGAEENIHEVLRELDAEDKIASKISSDGLLSSVDKGRPAQAVSNWVQCEDPKCMKWRKIPWYVDLDLLPEKFFCTDNKWNENANRCDAPEEDWDDADALVGDDGKVEGSPVRKRVTDDGPALPTESCFKVGARFDVQRSGKSEYTTASVVKVDFSGHAQRILFHFSKTATKHDEWIELGSSRIAQLRSKAPPSIRGKKKSKNTQAAFLNLTEQTRSPPTSCSHTATTESESACDLISTLSCKVKQSPCVRSEEVSQDTNRGQCPVDRELEAMRHYERQIKGKRTISGTLPTKHNDELWSNHQHSTKETEKSGNPPMTTDDDRSSNSPQVTNEKESTNTDSPMKDHGQSRNNPHTTKDDEQTNGYPPIKKDDEQFSDYQPAATENERPIHPAVEALSEKQVTDISTSSSSEQISALFHSIMPIEESSEVRPDRLLYWQGEKQRSEDPGTQEIRTSLEPRPLQSECTPRQQGDYGVSVRTVPEQKRDFNYPHKRSFNDDNYHRQPIITDINQMQQMNPKTSQGHHSFAYSQSRDFGTYQPAQWQPDHGSFSYHPDRKDHGWVDFQRIGDVRAPQSIQPPQNFFQRQVAGGAQNLVSNGASLLGRNGEGMSRGGGGASFGTTNYGSCQGFFNNGNLGIHNVTYPHGVNGGLGMNGMGTRYIPAQVDIPPRYNKNFCDPNPSVFPPSNHNTSNGVNCEVPINPQKASETIFQSYGNGHSHASVTTTQSRSHGTNWTQTSNPYVQNGSNHHRAPQR